MSIPSSQRSMALVLASAALVGLASCGSQDEASQLKEARARLDNKDIPAATIQLKTLLQKQPSSGEARFLLGKALLAQKEGPAAVVEFKKAMDLQFDPELVVPALAKAHLASGAVNPLIDQLGKVELKTPKAIAELQTSLALAQAILGQPAKSDAHVDAALRADPKNIEARLLKARRVAVQAKVQDGLKLVDELIAAAPSSAAALILKAELLASGLKDLDGGIAQLRRALELEPSNIHARTMLIELQLTRGDMAAYRAEVEGLSKVAPKTIETLYYRTQLAAMEDNLNAAREGVQALLRSAPQVPSVMQLAGLVFLRTNDVEAAKKHLTQAIAAAPDMDSARRMLAAAHIRSGEHEKALAVLAPLLGKQAPASDVLGLVAEAHLQAGHSESAEKFFAAASRADPEDAKPRVAMALADMRRGETQTGIAQLRELAAIDKTAYADLALISALTRRKDVTGALLAIDSLVRKMPGKPLPHLLRGQLLNAQSKPTEARANLGKALELDAKYFPAVMELAAMDVKERQFSRAQQRYAEILKTDPRNVEAALAVVEVRRAAGDSPPQLEQGLREVVARYPTEMIARVRLIEQLLRQGQTGQAVAAAKEGVLAVSSEPRLLMLLASAQRANGEVREAAASLGRAAAMQPASPEPHLQLAELHAAAKEYEAAMRSLNKAFELAPSSLPVQRRLLALAVLRNQFDEAVKVAQAVQKQQPSAAIGYQMEAEVQTLRKAWEPAIRASRAALERQPVTAQAAELHRLYRSAGREREAAAFAEDWLKRFPRDTAFLFNLGNSAMGRGELAVAERYFHHLLEIQPEHALTMNNLAFVLLRQDKPAEALVFAQRANTALPDNAAIMDTLATTFAANQRSKQALEWQRKAVDKDPAQSIYRLNLAKLQIAVGDRSAAKAELEKLAAQGGRFQMHAEVTTLLKGL